MKNILLIVGILFVCFIFFEKQRLFTSILAQNEIAVGTEKPVADNQARTSDRALAQTIRQLTNRSTEGLVEKKLPTGGSLFYLEERFQNVMLSRIEPDGEPFAACVTDLEEANAFFGRDLETGENLSAFQNRYQPDNTAKLAARHGMSSREFEFYKNLIEAAAIRRAENPSAATISIINGDGAGEGFNDGTAVAAEGGNMGTTRGAQRLNLFQNAADIWDSFIDSNVEIKVNSKFDPLTCSTGSAVLGSAGTTAIASNFANAQFTNTNYHFALANKQAGSDLSGGSIAAQINATFNSNFDTGCFAAGHRFYYGFDNTTPASRTNLLIVLLHEIGHGLGFSSFVKTLTVTDATNASPIVVTSASHNLTNGDQVTVQSALGNTAANGTWTVANRTVNTFELAGSVGNGVYTASSGIIRGANSVNGFPDTWSRLMFDRSTSKFWLDMTTAERSASILNTGNVMWDGANVKIASGMLTGGRDAATGRVQMFTPNPFQQGSSVSHFDTASTPNLLMEPSINVGLPLTLDLTRQQMRDIGWYRDSDVVLGADTITNVTPSGGTVIRGSTVNITWTNTGGFNKNVTIELSADGGTTYPTIIASDVVNTGSFSWTVPDSNISQARVRVREFDFVAPLAASSANFAIALVPTFVTVPITGRIANANGRGISSARISLTDSSGNLRTAQSSSFGYFRFQEVPVGATYFVSVGHKRYRFVTQVINLNEAVELNFSPLNK